MLENLDKKDSIKVQKFDCISLIKLVNYLFTFTTTGL